MKHITKADIEKVLLDNIELRSTQNKLCIPIINRLYLKMLIGIKFPEIKVAEDLIIDGHHRYVASLLSDFKIGRIPSVKTIAAVVTSWSKVELVEEDWDTKAKIEMLNKQDADYNNIAVERIIELLK